ncbi:Dolichyl-phosphate-mannose-protein mannosyltransferase-domain-containing protein [Zopfochytrium polystomum]|nr:Dolichyl-phosphate-mannose-protein mannosyltransferase-domain-containing protein [Zopfochytrium polystomum]
MGTTRRRQRTSNIWSQQTDIEDSSTSSFLWLVPVTLTVLSLWTRLYKIGWADFVVWDEAHFGKFASYYITRAFYFDVHPPLGKMLLGLAGHFIGFNGTFEFESGHKYPEDLNYAGFRTFPAIVGAAIVPLAYYTGVELHLSHSASIFLAVMALCDIALLAISRFILLDSMLLFFTALTAYCLCKFRNYQVKEPLSFRWYAWLAFTGLSLGCVASVKWVGLFAIALVGLHTIEDLWVMFGDIKMPWIVYLRHWIARIVLLIMLPVGVYVICFALHFHILNRSGTGDAQMSSLFQANLAGNNFHENPLYAAYGSIVSIKNNGHGGGLLHSHVQTYPSGSEQQQVTCYHHKDTNNDWEIRKPREEPFPEDIVFVKHNDTIRLVHSQTTRNLHSHDVRAPVTSLQNEVSGYGNETLGDVNDYWRIEVIDDLHGDKTGQIKSLTTRFNLRHVFTGCLLRSTGVTLPEWGFKQIEVVCQKNGDPKDPANIWNVEQHRNEKLPPGGAADFRPNFWRDFVDLNVAMWTSNNALTPDKDKEPDILTSVPYQWPLLLVGLRMCGWGDHELKFYLTGHPIVWLGSTASIIVFFVIGAIYLLRYQRKYKDWISPQAFDDFYFASKVGFLGWFLHYFPFWIMGRVMYIHHYFPALYFAIILFAHVTDHIGSKLPRVVHTLLLWGLTAAVIGVFVHFADFAFGMEGPASAYADRKWISSWNLYDDASSASTVAGALPSVSTERASPSSSVEAPAVDQAA